jgi:type I restriction enzyme S subunit
MSKIDELIKQLCPDGVELKKLWEVTYWDKRFNAVENYKQPQIVRYKYFLASELKPLIVEGGDIKILTTNISNLYTSEDLAEDNYSEGEIIAIPWGGNPIIQYYNGKFLTSDNRIAVSIDSNYLNTKYLYFYLLNNVDTISTFYRGAGIKHPNMSKVLDFQIPIPPLPIQEEIVNILDTFTTLEAELEAELEARKKQYTFYRDSLLSFEGKDVKWKTLGEVGEFVRGNGLQKKDFTESGVGCIHYGQIYTHYGTYAHKTKTFVSPELAKKLKKASKNDLVIAGVSENVEDVCKAVVWLGDEDICISGDAFIFKHKQNPKFIGYLFQTSMFLEFKKKYAQGAKVTRLQSGSLPKYLIPIPPIEEQERIANSLDKLDTLINNISIGLPAEIKSRRKQYEYYRNQLLTFNSISNE